MGKIKSERRDIVRPFEARVLLKMAGLMDPYKASMLQAVLGFLIGYGKRVSEVLALRVGDVVIEEDVISTYFLILKRGPVSGILPYRWKKLDRSHYTCEFIEPWVSSRSTPGTYIFPSFTQGGHVSRITIWKWMKALDPDIWPHLFRHSLATQLAEGGASAFELKAFFDWASLGTAERYVQETPQLREKWIKREF